MVDHALQQLLAAMQHPFVFVVMDGVVHFVQNQLINAKEHHAIMVEHVNQVMVGFDVHVHKDFRDQIAV